tara:strand:+ start:5501 stop:6130 length:630 start_codon:yes stop_codon:yes gene_type:complete
MNEIVNKEPSLDDLMFVLNKCIKFKDSNNKQNIRKKIKKNDKEDILTQLAYVVHTNIMNKSVIEIKSEDSLETKRDNLQLQKKVNDYEYTINQLEQTIKTLKVSNSSLRENYNNIEDYKNEIKELKYKLNEKKEVYKPIVNNNDKIEIEDLKKINERLVKRIHNGDFDNPTDKDITIRNLKEDIENMKQQHKMELLLDEQNMLNDLNKI